jgi:hypothetical protein
MESTTRTNEYTVTDGASAGDAPTTEINVSGVGDNCAQCGARLAPDQRYCVECGERRGASRLPFEGGRRQRESAPRRAARPRMSANSTLIAGVGTLLLAMGIGVLIGRSGNSSSSKSPPVQVVSVAGAGGGGTAATGAGTSGAAATTSSTSGKTKKAAKTTAPASVGAAKVAPTKGKVVKVGTPGSGPGYQGGKFTGNFFGG